MINHKALTARLTRSRKLIALLAVLLVLATMAPSVLAVQGSIHPKQIQIDDSTLGADHYPNLGVPKNTGAQHDWSTTASTATGVDPNTGANCLAEPPIATCNQAGVTAAATGKGAWNGVRIVDGIGGGDQDIFLRGGKELDFSTWDVGPGTIGSRKYDMTQGYLANNQQYLYAGGERNGNNGTTAYVIEFNQAAPASTYVPTRTKDDVQFVFEMQGSGNEAGSVESFVYQWNGATFVQVTGTALNGLLAAINHTPNTPSPPWGHVVNDTWVTSNLIRREFFEAQVPLSLLPGVDNCGGFAYVQFRTRASAGITSDLKDATPIFKYEFGGPDAKATVSTDCEQQFTYDGTGSTNSSGGSSGLEYKWDITVNPTTATLSGGGVSAVAGTPGKYTSTAAKGTVSVALPDGVNSATITLKNTVKEGTDCADATGDKIVTVYRLLGATATLTPACDNTFAFSSTVSGGKAPYSYAWVFQKNSKDDGTGDWLPASGAFISGSATSASGVFQAAVQGRYRALLTVKDAADKSTDSDVTPKPQCEATATSNAINVYDPVAAAISLTPDCDDTFAYSARGSGGKAPYQYSFTVEKLISGAWVKAHEFTASDTVANPGVSGELDVDDFASGANGNGRYRMRVTIRDSQAIVCQDNETSNEIDVAHQLTVTDAKTNANGTTMTVTLTGAPNETAGVAYQWQRKVGDSWVNITGATAATLDYKDFEADAKSSDIQFTIGTTQYKGQLYEVTLRVRAYRTLNGQLCEAFSEGEPVSKVIAVDP